MNLQQLAETMRSLLSEEDWDEQTFADTLEAIEGEVDLKIVARGLALKMIKLDAEVAKTLEANFRDKRRSLERRAEWLSEDTARHMQALDKTKVKGAVTVSYVHEAKVLIEGEVPEEFKKASTSYYPDKTALRDQIHGGNPVPGARLVDGIRVR